jgi:hypothetical protein
MISEPCHAHFGVDDADGIVFRVIGAEGVGTDQLGKAVGLVCIGAAHRPHFVQDDRQAAPGDLPGGFGAGQAAADDVDRGE